MEEFGAASFDALGFDREALVLQAHEEFANGVYDEIYGELENRHSRQDAILRYASLLSPVLAMQRLSMGIAGTDLLAQQGFAGQAEQHRRLIIAQLNRDMMMHAGDQGFAYTAGRALWESVPEFKPSPPGLGEVLRHYRLELFVLLLWTLGAGMFALRATRMAMEEGSRYV